MILHLIRAGFLLAVLGLTTSFAFQQNVIQKGPEYITLYILIPALVASLLIILDMFWRRKRLNILSGLFFGLLAGLVIAYALSLMVELGTKLYPAPTKATNPPPLASMEDFIEKNSKPLSHLTAAKQEEQENLLRETYQGKKKEYEEQLQAFLDYENYEKSIQLLKLLLGSTAVFVCVTIVMQSKDDFRFIIPYVEFSKQAKGAKPIVLDSSVIIDGRIADLIDTNIFQAQLLVPRFILAEIQTIADSADKLKRNRGRRGLDVLQKLQQNPNADIEIYDIHVMSVHNARDVDAKLVALAEHMSARVMTNDYNLNKIAQLRGIDVININDLSNALKPIVLPGESMKIRLIRAGEEAGQGVGYLDDGTMVVVDQARQCIGKDAVDIIITSALQTSAGRMIFGKLPASHQRLRSEKR